MNRAPVTTERIERALAFVAYLVARDDEGEVYLPILDRLEEELADRRRRELPRDRARRLLAERFDGRNITAGVVQQKPIAGSQR